MLVLSGGCDHSLPAASLGVSSAMTTSLLPLPLARSCKEGNAVPLSIFPSLCLLCCPRACLGKMITFSKYRNAIYSITGAAQNTRGFACLGEVNSGPSRQSLLGIRHFFLSFPYVCPEPVLVKSCILYINGISKSAVFSPKVTEIETRRHTALHK
eukprot:COSAG06_NODE_4692_length_4031_cov_4.370869_1_plen_155_part_00